MTQQDIIEMIGEAGGYGHNTCEQNEKSFYPFMERFAKLVEERAAAKEREACAKVCDQLESGKYEDGFPAAGMAWECANAIRARGQA